MTEISTIRDGLRALASLRSAAQELSNVQPSRFGAGRVRAEQLRGQAVRDARTAIDLLGPGLLGADSARRIGQLAVTELGAAPLRREPLNQLGSRIVDAVARADVHDRLVTTGTAGRLGLPMHIDGSRGIVDSLAMLPPGDQSRYQVAWRLQLDGLAGDTAAADARIRALLEYPGSAAGSRELDALLHAHGGAARLELIDRIAGVGRSADVFATSSRGAARERFVEAWQHQLAAGSALQATADRRIADLLDAGQLRPSEQRELRRLALDLGRADALGLPRDLPGVGPVGTVLAAADADIVAVDRIRRAWRASIHGAAPGAPTPRERLGSLLSRPDVANDPEALRDLRTIAVDLRAATDLGIGQTLGYDPAAILASAIAREPGGVRLAGRMLDAWRGRLALGPAALAQLDDEARGLIDELANGTATSSQHARLRELVFEYGSASRLELPERLAAVRSGWTAFHDPAIARRHAASWRELLEHPDPDERSAVLRDLVLDQRTDPATANRVRTLALDLGGSWQLGLPTRLPGDDVGRVLDDAASGSGDPARFARVQEAWHQAIRPSEPGIDALRADVAQVIAGGPLDDARAGRLMHLLLDRDAAALLQRPLDPAEVVHMLSAHGRRDAPHVAESMRLGMNVALDTIDGRAMQDAAMDELRTGGRLGTVQARMLRLDDAIYGNLRPELRLAVLAAAAPSRMGEVAAWLDDVERTFAIVDADLLPPVIREQVATLVDRNRSRLAGHTPEGAVRGYATHPDYAEIGAIASHAELAAQLAHATRAAPTISAAPVATAPAAAPTDLLSW